MILQALVQYYENLVKQGEVSKLGWCNAKVSHAIELNEDGTIKGIIFRKTERENGKKKIWEPDRRQVPEMVTKSSGIISNFLCGNAKYFLGIDADGTNARTKKCFQAAKDKHLMLLADAEGTMAKAICRYFENWDPETAKENPAVKEHWDELNEGGNLVFCMGIQDAQDDEEIKEIWENSRNQNCDEKEGICLVTGKRTEIARIHRGIKGVPGAQSSGAVLVSFNEPAFESYGKEQSYNAPVGKYAEFAYTTALNYLLDQKDYRFSLGDSMTVFWAESGKKEYPTTFFSLMNPKIDNQKEMKKVFGNLSKGIWVDVDDIKLNPEQKFYILCLAPNAARLSVRFFYENSYGNILKNLAKHYERMRIVRPSWEEREYLGIKEMLDETVNQKLKEKTAIPNMAAMVLKAVLEDDKYPASLYTDVLIRIRAEQGKVTYGRAAIVKAFLIKNYQWKEGENYMSLNEHRNEEPQAYVLGEIFAVLEEIQERASETKLNATIRDKYFNSACTAPASVFPILIRLKNSHIRKIEHDNTKGKKGKVYYERLLTELMCKINMDEPIYGFKKILSLEEQGQFILGYYHQVQKRYEKKEK